MYAPFCQSFKISKISNKCLNISTQKKAYYIGNRTYQFQFNKELTSLCLIGKKKELASVA